MRTLRNLGINTLRELICNIIGIINTISCVALSINSLQSGWDSSYDNYAGQTGLERQQYIGYRYRYKVMYG